MQCYLDVNSGANSVLIRVLIRATNLENTEPIEEPPLVLHLAAQLGPFGEHDLGVEPRKIDAG